MKVIYAIMAISGWMWLVVSFVYLWRRSAGKSAPSASGPIDQPKSPSNSLPDGLA